MNKYGFTLIELVTVVAILAILSSLIILSFSPILTKVKKQSCMHNCSKLEQVYESQLILANIYHNDGLFQSLLDTYGIECPSGGTIGYDGTKVTCSEHMKIDEPEETEDNSVPYLFWNKHYMIFSWIT